MALPPKEQSNSGKKKGTFEKLDEAYAESSMEDQLLVYWNRHKNQILTGLTGALLLIVGFQLSKWWSQKTVSDRSQAYAAATVDSEKEAFADNFSGTDLGGVAYMELADNAYNDGDFATAVSLYEKAFEAFDMVEFKQRAHLGLAMARFQAGDESDAFNDLESIADNAGYPDAARGEALYQLSVVDWKNGSFETMLQRHERIETLTNAGNWQGKALQLQNSIPELKKLVEAKAAEGLTLGN
jgi:predicted negative regulator of RcsB-dependent stress response